MKFIYSLDRIVGALTYNDLKGLLNILNCKEIFEKELTIEEMEELFKEYFFNIEDRSFFKQVESLMLSCARVNSIGY